MLETFVGLLLVNLAGLIPPGPYTLIIVQYAKNKAKTATLYFITGSFIADIFIALVLYLGFQPFLENPYFKAALSLVGGMFLFSIGIQTFKAKSAAVDESINSESSNSWSAFRQGVFVAILHPAYWVWWSTVGITYLHKSLGYGLTGAVLFFLAFIIPVYGWFGFLYKVVAASSDKISDTTFDLLIKICGVALLGFAVWLFVDGLLYLR